ncbi:MAG: LD-carboxypeptidase [Dehalococcoidales bacterium]|nr:LD-carboxypeptidase [Dehalococcoidales bacterium]
MKYVYPPKLRKGDEIRVIAPSRSLAIIGESFREASTEKLEALGFILSFGKHINECNDFDSTSIESRLEDLHDAFINPDVKAVLTVIGGYNSNQLLRYIDWDLIKNNPKIFCGFSDITALNNAILAKTGLVTYSGPHYIIFGHQTGYDYTVEYFLKCVCEDTPFRINPAPQWCDWDRDPEKCKPVDNEGFWVINDGQATGRIIGGNLCTFNLLQGTEFMPDLEDSVLFIEDDSESSAPTFDRDLQSLIHQPGFSGVQGIVIGRFQNDSRIDRRLLTQIIKTKKELDTLPVIGNADFGHTDPKITFPVGGTVDLSVNQNSVELIIREH